MGRVCKTTHGVCESNSSTARRTLGCDCEVGPPWYRLGRALRAQSTRTCVYSWCVYTGLRACFYGTSRQAERQFKRTCASSAEWAAARPRPARLSWPVPARLAIKPNKASIKGRLEGRLAIVRLGAGRAAGRPPHFRGATPTRSGDSFRLSRLVPQGIYQYTRAKKTGPVGHTSVHSDRGSGECARVCVSQLQQKIFVW